MKRILTAVFFFSSVSVCSADILSSGGNSVPTLTANRCVQTDSNGQLAVAGGACGGGGASSLETIFGSAESSPTATLKGAAGQFTGSVTGSTMTMTLDASSVTLQGNTFNGASQLVKTNGSTQLPAISGVNLTHITAANIDAGSLGGSVLASSVAVAAVGVPQINATGSAGNTTFLRGDGAWQVPAGGGGSPGGASGQVQYNNASSFGGASSMTWNGTDLLIGGTTIAAYVDPSNCLFDYRMDEGAGTTLINYCGTSGNAAFSAGGQAPTWAADGGVTFNSAKSVIVSTTDWVNIKTFTVAIKPDTNTQYTNSAAGNGYGLILSGSGNTCFTSFSQIRQVPLVNQGAGDITIANQRATGTHVITYEMTSPSKIFVDGKEVTGYITSGSCTPQTATLALLGDFGGAAGAGYGFTGEMYYATASSVTWTATQVAKNYSAIRTMLRNRGIEITPQTVSGPIQAWYDGDSIAAGAGVNLYNKTWENFVAGALPISMIGNQVGLGGVALSTLITNAKTVIDPQIAAHIDSKNIVTVVAGYNDISGGGSAATVYGNLRTYLTDRKSAGAYTVAHTVTNGTSFSGAQELVRENYNNCVSSGSIGVNADCGATQINTIADATDFWGLDPYMGTANAFANYPGFYFDSIHPNSAGNMLAQTYMSPAIMKAAGYGYWPVCNRYTYSISASSWTVGINGQAAVNIPLIATATVQAVPMYWLGPKYKVAKANIRPTTAFSGSGYTSFTLNVGDSVGGNSFYTSANTDLTVAGPTSFSDFDINKSTSTYGSQVNAVFTASQNMATHPFTGVVDVDLCISSIP